MLAVVLIFGTNFALSRAALRGGLTAYDLAALRFATAGLVLAPLFLHRGAADCAGVGWGRGLLLTLMSGIPLTLLMNVGLSLAPAAHGASVTPGTVTLVGLAAGAVLLGVRPSPPVLVGVAVVAVGLACIGLAGTLAGPAVPVPETGSAALGDLCFVSAGLLWGLYPFLIQRWGVSPMTGTAVVAVLSCAYLPLYALLLEPRLATAPPGLVLFHAFNQGVLNIIVGLWLWGFAARVLGAAVAARFPPLIPVVGTASAVPIVGEVPGPLQAGGIALIVAGLAVAAVGDRLLRR